jgi:hypothetical protein
VRVLVSASGLREMTLFQRITLLGPERESGESARVVRAPSRSDRAQVGNSTMYQLGVWGAHALWSAVSDRPFPARFP